MTFTMIAAYCLHELLRRSAMLTGKGLKGLLTVLYYSSILSLALGLVLGTLLSLFYGGS